MSYVPVIRGGYVPTRTRTRGRLAGLGDATGVDTTIIVQQVLAQYHISDAQLQTVVNGVMDKYGAQMKTEAVDRAAVSAGLDAAALVMAYIPVIGWIGAAAIAVVQAGLQVTESYYQKQANTIIAAAQNEVRLQGVQYDAQIDAYKTQVLKQEAPAAVALALSGVPLNGLGELSGLGKSLFAEATADAMRFAMEATTVALKPVRKVTHNAIQLSNNIVAQVPIPAVQNAAAALNKLEGHLYDNMDATEAAYDQFIQVGTGEAQMGKAQEAANLAKTKALAELKRQYDLIIANLNAPSFRAQLRTAMAVFIRTGPAGADIQQMIGSGLLVPGAPAEPAITLTTAQPNKALQVLPAAGAGAAALIALVAFGHR